MSKALLIKSYTDLTTGVPGEWNELTMASTYIQGIQTGQITEGASADQIAALISGVPTPWARAKLFKFALSTLNAPDPNIGASGLTQYYEMLHGEWRGLLALLALYPDRINFSAPIKMDPKGDDYNITSAFGRMLFNDKDIWRNTEEAKNDPDALPFIQLIYYRGHLIGGTSPMTGWFTGVKYNLGSDATDVDWYRNGKLESPSNLSPEQIQKLYLFVKNLNNNMDEFVSSVFGEDRDRADKTIAGFKAMLRKWEDEIKRAGRNLREIGPLADYENLAAPFSILFKSDVPVYMKPDFTFTYQNGEGYIKIGNIQDLLSKDQYVMGWVESQDQLLQKLSDAPVYFLQAHDLKSNERRYFTIPFSERGIECFRNNLSQILGYDTGGNTHLSATINDAGQLSVKLDIEIDGESVTLNTREYDITWMDETHKVIMWPNFVSNKWKKYYLYSGFTPEGKRTFHPIFIDYPSEAAGGRDEIFKDGKGNFYIPEYKPEPGEKLKIQIDELITYPSGKVDGNMPKYSVLTADKPFEGLLAMVKQNGVDVRAGFLMLKHSKVKNLSSIDVNMDAVVGIDFGSNNTCVYYTASDGEAEPVEFKNYRAVLVGDENIDNRANAANDELLFFTNYESDNGQLKSWLHEHDSRYFNPGKASDEIVGGVPVSRPNVVVREMDDRQITTQAGVLHYNMKWLDDDKGREKKRAFLKSIWLQVNAFLYEKRMRPTQIRWSYPGSMMQADVNEYDNIFESLAKMDIANGPRPDVANPITEAEAVCSYALSKQEIGLGNNNLYLGIDVGGSTSDILLLARNRAKGNDTSLYRESSIRLAAGVFFNAVIKSEAFRRALVNFHEGRGHDVYVSNIREILDYKKKAPYYLNNIFDQLRGEDYDTFYDAVYRDAKFVFTIPAYVTGLLLFYSGMLIGKTVKDNGLDEISKVDILSFGKGGRLFHWLRSSVGRRPTDEYYKACVNAGVKLITDKEFDVAYRSETEADNKAEVARGLCSNGFSMSTDTCDKSDICGEKGVTFIESDGQSRAIDVEDKLTGEYFADRMQHFAFNGCENFEVFMKIFIDFVSQQTKLYPNADQLLSNIQELPSRIATFICNNDREYKKAQNNAKGNNSFAYHQPIIIAEGITFLSTLIDKAFGR